MKNKKGFTLIELLVVIAIIALLLSILLPSLRTAKAIAKRVVCSTNMKGSGSGFHTFAADNNDELPVSFYAMPRKDGKSGMFYSGMTVPYRAFRALEVDLSAPAGAQYPDYIKRWGVGSTPNGDHAGWKLNGTKRVWGFGTLYDARIIENPKVFYCPSSTRSDGDAFKMDTYSDGHSWPWWNTKSTGSTSVKESVSVSYYYLPQASRKKLRSADSGLPWEVAAMATKASQLSANNVMSVDMMANNFFTHEIGKKKGVNALYGDGSVAYSFNPEVFGHSMWDEGKPNINSMATAFRAVIFGIEGKTSYMSTIP